MRHLGLLLMLPALLSAQAPGLDEGRLDAGWFGPVAVFQSSKQLGFQWLKPGLDLRRRSIRVRASTSWANRRAGVWRCATATRRRTITNPPMR